MQGMLFSVHHFPPDANIEMPSMSKRSSMVHLRFVVVDAVFQVPVPVVDRLPGKRRGTDEQRKTEARDRQANPAIQQ